MAEQSTGKVRGTERVRLVATVYPLEFFARSVGRDRVEVTNLIAPGVEAHDFEPSPSHMRLMRDADVIVYNGAGLEPWMTRALRSLNGDPIVVEAAHGLATAAQGDGDGHTDPHVWLDLGHAASQVDQVRNALIRAAPEHKAEFRANADKLHHELAQLDAEYRDAVEACTLKTFVTSHAAFGYLAERYGLVQVPISGLSPESEPAPRKLADLTSMIAQTGVKYVLAESEASSRLSRTVAEEIGAQVLSLDPLESLSPNQVAGGEDFISIMRDNLDALETALECGP